ncbi:AI-2E family transporter [Chelativorans sp. J32]|uniref:AI-2E family transporter n=1 Tax=Chelativorans sp. J32 TaxID=935840 RepID=UPI0004B8135A|nr:AI-2E family transporter [Chelativorans sp. J32]
MTGAPSGGQRPREQDGEQHPYDEYRGNRYLLIGIFLILFVLGLYFARDFFMPVMLAFLLAMTLTPIVRFLGKRGIPAAVSATLLVLASWSVIGIIVYSMSGPVIDMINDAPRIGNELRERVSQIRRPLEQVMDASEEIQQAADTAREPDVQRVVIAQPGIISRAAGNLLSVATTVGVTLVLSLFLLASGTLLYEKIIQSFGRLSDKKRALRIVFDVEREVSRYLLTIALINTGLGVAVGAGLWGLGVPNALVWGVAAALLNFLPYVGAVVTFSLVAAISLVTFDNLYYAILPPLYVVLCNIIEGQFLTPVVLGRRLELNAVAIFIAVAFWSWLWGLVGALLAVPLLVVIKVFCDHFEGLRHVANFLAAQSQVDIAEDEPH